MTLTKLVLEDIQAHAKAVVFNEALLLDRLKKQLSSDSDTAQEGLRLEIGRLRRRIQELEKMTAKLYEDKVCGTISTETFATLIQNSELERVQKSERLDSLLMEVRQYEQTESNIQTWASIIRKHLGIKELDREIVDELIDRIEIGERAVIDGQKQHEIKIYYRFVGLIGTEERQ